MKNLTTEIQELLRNQASSHIYSFIYPRIPAPEHKKSLIQEFIECFEAGTSNSEAFTIHEVVSKTMGWKLDRRNFLNEYWVDTIHSGIVKVWGKNKTSVRKYLSSTDYGKVLKIVLVKEFDKKEFIKGAVK